MRSWHTDVQWLLSGENTPQSNSELFESWFNDLFLPNAVSARSLLKLLDRHNNHYQPDVNLALKYEVVILCLPPHTTQVIQPLSLWLVIDSEAFSYPWAAQSLEVWDIVGPQFQSRYKSGRTVLYSICLQCQQLEEGFFINSIHLNKCCAAFSQHKLIILPFKKLPPPTYENSYCYIATSFMNVLLESLSFCMSHVNCKTLYDSNQQLTWLS